jgi:hypothetical protein
LCRSRKQASSTGPSPFDLESTKPPMLLYRPQPIAAYSSKTLYKPSKQTQTATTNIQS